MTLAANLTIGAIDKGRVVLAVVSATSGLYDTAPAAAVDDTPTTFTGGAQTGQHANNYRSNGLWTGNGAAALPGGPLGNWLWQLDVTVTGDWIQQRYKADNRWGIYRRESFNGGTSWTGWVG